MEILNKIKNKSFFGFAFALLISISFIPSVNQPFIGNSSYLSFSDYGLIIGVLMGILTFLIAIAEEKWHEKTLKGIVGLLWVFFLFEIFSGLLNFKDIFGNYNITSILQLGAYTSIVLFIIVTFNVIRFKPSKTDLENLND